VNWSWPDNRGGTKYLRKCFVDHQVLRVLTVEGDTRYLEAEKDINKFRTALPAYAKLLEDLAALEGKGQANLLQFLKPFLRSTGKVKLQLLYSFYWPDDITATAYGLNVSPIT